MGSVREHLQREIGERTAEAVGNLPVVIRIAQPAEREIHRPGEGPDACRPQGHPRRAAPVTLPVTGGWTVSIVVP